MTSPVRALLAERSFVLYQGVRFFTVVAMNMMSVAIGAEVFAETHDPLALGFSGLAQFVPQFLLVLVTGAAADRFPRRAVLIVCHAVVVVVALALSELAARPTLDVTLVYAVLALFGTARAFAGPAGQAITPSLVPAELFARAVGWNATTFQIAVALGPALGGALYRPLGPSLLYLCVAALEALVIVQLMFVRERPYERKTGEPALERIFAGMRYVRDHRAILGCISLDLFAVLLGGAVALMPIYATDVLHVGEAGLGALRAAPAIGALVVAIVLGIRPLQHRAGRTMMIAVGLFGLATIAFGLSESFVLSLALLFVVGAADMVSVVVRSIVVQATTPPDMRGRVSAVNMVFVGASNELGEFESGLMARLLGTVMSVVVGGVGTLAVTAYYWVFFPELREVDRPEGEAKP
jgi:MFS family permease